MCKALKLSLIHKHLNTLKITETIADVVVTPSTAGRTAANSGIIFTRTSSKKSTKKFSRKLYHAIIYTPCTLDAI